MNPAATSTTGTIRHWRAVPGTGYCLDIEDLGVQLDLTRVRRDRHETIGLLTARAKFKGARTIADGILSSADFNCSSLRARTDRAKHLAERARVDSIDWIGILEELCLRTLEAEDQAEPVRTLSDLIVPDLAVELKGAGLPLLRDLPVIWFGDGSTGKSYLALYAMLDLVQQGHRVLYCDWEFSGDEHRRRLAALVGPSAKVEGLKYLRVHAPLTHELGRLRDIVARERITYVVCDSTAAATEGAPEEAQSTKDYFNAVRALGVGSLHIAHISKSEQGDQKPFGSAFWFNLARSVWFLKRSEADDSDEMTVAFYHRKANTGRTMPALAMRICFSPTGTVIRPADVTDDDDLAQKAPLWQRMKGVLSRGALTAAALAEQLEANPESVARIARRSDRTFARVTGTDGIARIALVSGRGSESGY